jgi:hypothetical protein
VPAPGPKWISVSISIDADRNVLHIAAVDDAGDIWFMIRQGDRDRGEVNTWVKLAPPHP